MKKSKQPTDGQLIDQNMLKLACQSNMDPVLLDKWLSGGSQLNAPDSIEGVAANNFRATEIVHSASAVNDIGMPHSELKRPEIIRSVSSINDIGMHSELNGLKKSVTIVVDE